MHFIRNLLAVVPKTHQQMAAALFTNYLRSARRRSLHRRLGACLFTAIMAETCNRRWSLPFIGFPQAHWLKIWSTNPLKRINKEIKRRSRVVGVFPNPASAIRLVGTILANMHDEWQATGRRLPLSGLHAATHHPAR